MKRGRHTSASQVGEATPRGRSPAPDRIPPNLAYSCAGRRPRLQEQEEGAAPAQAAAPLKEAAVIIDTQSAAPASRLTLRVHTAIVNPPTQGRGGTTAAPW
jgi:hypothetical protein